MAIGRRTQLEGAPKWSPALKVLRKKLHRSCSRQHLQVSLAELNLPEQSTMRVERGQWSGPHVNICARVNRRRCPAHDCAGTSPSPDRHVVLCPAERQPWQIFANGSRGHVHSELQQELVGDPLLTPGNVLTRDLANQLLQFDRDWSPAKLSISSATTGQSPCGANRQRSWAARWSKATRQLKPAAEQHQSEMREVVGPARPNLALLIECEVLPQE
jgi:hypothetical protein